MNNNQGVFFDVYVICSLC